MASSNNAPQIGLPSRSNPAHVAKETPDQILANFQEIFSSQIEPDVVLLIFTECDFNENATLECLFALIGESSEGKSNKEQSARASNINLNKSSPDAPSAKSIYKNRLSTIYKSNEGLYCEDVALNGEELNQFSEESNKGRPLFAQYSNCLDATQKTQSVDLSLNLCKATTGPDTSALPDQVKSTGDKLKTTFKYTHPDHHSKAKWTGVSDLEVFSDIQDPTSPYSDKSIEADASEQINIEVGNVSQLSITDCNSSAQLNAMAGKQNKKGKSQQDVQSSLNWWEGFGQAAVQVARALAEYGDQPTAQRMKSQGVQQKRNTNKPAIHQNAQVKKNQNIQTHLQRRQQQHQYQKPMSPKEYVMMRIADGHKILVLLRGCPGSGKTTLAREIRFKGVIYSADNFFIKNGEYCFDPARLPEAHAHNKFLTMRAMQAGRTPIIIDNTNLLGWEMEPYVALAMQNQYYICLLEPSTPWRYDPRQLTMKNTHNIGYDKIVNMLQRFDRNVTVRSMIEQYNNNNRSTNARPPNISSNRAATPNPKAKVFPHPRRKRKPKVNPQMPETSMVAGASGGQPIVSTVYESSDSDTDSDGWSEISNNAQASFWDLTEPNEKLQKSKSVPDLMHAETHNSSIKPLNAIPSTSHDTSSFTYGLINPNIKSTDRINTVEPELSENMRDLMDLDFSSAHIQPPYDVNNSMHQDGASTFSETRRIGRLAAAFKDIPPDWDVPDYPSEIENGNSDEAKSESRLISSQEGLASNASPLDQDLISTSNKQIDLEDVMPKMNDIDQLSALKSFFSNVPDEYLKDIYEKCNGDLTWVVDLLLDAGYEMCIDKPAEDLFQKSGSSLEGLAEISPDINDAAESSGTDNSSKELYSEQSEQSSTTEVTIRDGQPGSSWKDSKLFLRIDPIFAMQLQEMFGPVGFHLSPASYYGSDLGIFIPTEVARNIHSCWTDSLKAKFESEDAEIDKMMDSVTLDENYAKRLQEEEDHILATTLQSDPLGEHFPPLETKHLLITLEKATPKTEDLASRIKRRQLYEMFPKIDKKALDEVFKANNSSFSEAVQAVEVSFCPDQKPTLVIAPEQLEEYERALVKFAEQESLLLVRDVERSMKLVGRKDNKHDFIQEMGRKKKTLEEDESDYSEPTYDDWRTEASLHYRLRQDCFLKAKEAYDKGMMAAASFYSQQGRVHSQKLHEANKRASEKILESKNAHRKTDTLDLHMLHVNEAINALAEFLGAKKQELLRGSSTQATLRIITGRGNHSAMGVPRIKPAVLEFLAKQNYSHCESNGGLIEVFLRK